jgi:hypothetical protein
MPPAWTAPGSERRPSRASASTRTLYRAWFGATAANPTPRKNLGESRGCEVAAAADDECFGQGLD